MGPIPPHTTSHLGWPGSWIWKVAFTIAHHLLNINVIFYKWSLSHGPHGFHQQLHIEEEPTRASSSKRNYLVSKLGEVGGSNPYAYSLMQKKVVGTLHSICPNPPFLPLRHPLLFFVVPISTIFLILGGIFWFIL